MSDQFDAQLRQHLLETADARPVDGQLASVIDGVAVTTQRHPLTARLTWDPGRIGPLPSAALRYGLIAVGLFLATIAGAILGGGGAPAPSTVFEGTWIAIDPADRSGMTLVVGPGQAPDVYFEDGYASGEACVDDPVKRFSARGTGEISGNRLIASFPDGGGCGRATVRVEGRYDHAPVSDALVDQDGLIWNRALAVTDALPTDVAPTPGPSSASVSDPGQKCFDIPAGGEYRNEVEGVSLTVTIPAPATFRWQGNRDWFGVEDDCFAGGPVVITATAVKLILGSCGHTFGRPPSPALAVDWLIGNEDYTTSEPTQTTIGGYPATRFEVSFESSACPDGYELWSGSDVSSDSTWIVYIVDVDVEGVPLGVTIRNRGGAAPAAQVAEAEAIVATLEIAR